MGESIYEWVVSVTGTIPPQFHFIYAILTTIVVLLVVFIALSPFLLAFRLLKR
jgi:ABC-type antimicrobial peptide transport system permease subunit